MDSWVVRYRILISASVVGQSGPCDYVGTFRMLAVGQRARAHAADDLVWALSDLQAAPARLVAIAVRCPGETTT
jgi:hypothetical protein